MAAPFIEKLQEKAKEVASTTPVHPLTRTRTNYGATLHCKVGARRAVIGGVFYFQTQQGRAVDEEFCVDALAQGLPTALVPQAVTTRTLSIGRYDLFTQTIEEVFGSPEILTLAGTPPLTMRISWRDPVEGVTSLGEVGQFLAQTVSAAIRTYEFIDCHITDLGRTIETTGDRIVKANANMTWRDLRRLQ